MAVQLVVRHPFAGYQIGAHITDQALVAKFSASHPSFVVKKVLEASPSIPVVPTPPKAAPSKPAAAPATTSPATTSATPAPASAPASTSSPTPPTLTPIV